jgi:oligosaccharide repeat unit polymerase
VNNIYELPLVLAITVTCVVFAFHALRSRELELFSPRALYVAMTLYYSVLGPLVFLLEGSTIVFGLETRSVLWKGWLATALALAAFLLGYQLRSRRKQISKIKGEGQSVVILSGFLFTASGLGMGYWIFNFGGGLRFFNPQIDDISSQLALSGFQSVAATYLAQLINLSFGAILLLFVVSLDSRSLSLKITFYAATLIVFLFYLKTGFRYRILWLVVGLLAAHSLYHKRQPPVSVLALFGAVVVFAMGLIGLTRNYFSGLDLERLGDTTLRELFVTGFSESGIFIFVSNVIDVVPRELPHTYLDPFWIAITAPIPRAYWSAKPTSLTLETLAATFGSKDAIEAGLAVPYYGEWYIAFGWTGVVVSSLLLGFVSRWVWNWYMSRQGDKLALVIYSVSLGFMYLVFSRGLLAQVLMNFLFSLMPLIVIYGVSAKAHVNTPWKTQRK